MRAGLNQSEEAVVQPGWNPLSRDVVPVKMRASQMSLLEYALSILQRDAE